MRKYLCVFPPQVEVNDVIMSLTSLIDHRPPRQGKRQLRVNNNEVIGVYSTRKPSVEWMRGFVSVEETNVDAAAAANAAAAAAATPAFAADSDEIEVELGLVGMTQCCEEFVIVYIRKNPVNTFLDTTQNPVDLGRWVMLLNNFDWTMMR